MHPEAELDQVAAELNDRPRKRLRFRKPVEQIADLLRDGAPAAAQRRGGTTLTPTSGGPPSGGEEGAKACLLNPASAARKTLDTAASANVALSQEAVCVATTTRIRRSAYGRRRTFGPSC